VFADGDFDPASDVSVAPLPSVNQPPRPRVTPTKSSSEQFGLPEGVNVSHFMPCSLAFANYWLLLALW